MNENVESMEMKNQEITMMPEMETNEFSDDFFEQKDMEEPQNEQWHTDEEVVLNANQTENNEDIPVVVEKSVLSDVPSDIVEDEFVSLEQNTTENETSDFDAYFESLYDDVEGANNLISEIIEKKKNIKENEDNINHVKEELAKEKIEFDKFVEAQKESLELEKKQFEEFMKTQKARMEEEEQQLKSDMEVKNRELNLKSDTLKIEREKLDADKSQFNKYKETEETKLQFEKEKIASEQARLEKDTILSLQTIQNEQKELEMAKEHFAQQKEAEEKKIALEKENLAQSCAKFKQLVSQFNNNFAKLPENKE